MSKTSLYLDDELMNWLRAIAYMESTSITRVIEEATRNHVEAKKAEHGKSLEAVFKARKPKPKERSSDERKG